MRIVDLTASPAGGFATHVLALLGHEVCRPVEGSSAPAPLNRQAKQRIAAADRIDDLASDADAMVVDDWYLALREDDPGAR